VQSGDVMHPLGSSIVGYFTFQGSYARGDFGERHKA
jgi:hypothetical protein